jgi:hypothetical protein
MEFVEPSKTHADVMVSGEVGSNGPEEVLATINSRLG